jgi:hypothetical protein
MAPPQKQGTMNRTRMGALEGIVADRLLRMLVATLEGIDRRSCSSRLSRRWRGSIVDLAPAAGRDAGGDRSSILLRPLVATLEGIDRQSLAPALGPIIAINRRWWFKGLHT